MRIYTRDGVAAYLMHICGLVRSAVPVNEVVRRRILDVENAMAELRRLTSKEFREMSLDEVYSMRYNVIVLVEALTALAAHVLVEKFGYRPRTYVEAVEQLAKRLGVACVDRLKALVRLRNLLVHAYWTIDDERVHRSIREDFTCVRELLEKLHD